MKRITLTAVPTRIGAALFLLAVSSSAAAPVMAQAPGDYLVTVGKRPMWASQVPPRATVRDDSRPQIGSNGAFYRLGKSILFGTKPDAAKETKETPASRIGDESRPQTKSRGRFVQRGKSIVWVPDAPGR